MHIGERIKRLRKLAKLTQKELGQVIHKSAQVISNWERSYTPTINYDDLVKLAEALNVTIYDLVGNYPLKLQSTSYKKVIINITEDDLALLEKIKQLPVRDKKLIDAMIKLNVSEDGTPYKGE